MNFEKMTRDELVNALTSRISQSKQLDPVDKLQQTIHELQVYQIELEMQNRELQETQSALEESRDRYADLYDFAPVGYMTLDDKGCIREINLTGALMLGVERKWLIGKPFRLYMAKNHRTILFQHLQQCIRTDEQITVDVTIESKTGSLIHAQLQTVIVNNFAQQPPRFRTAIIDLTERKSLEQELTRHRDHLEKLVEARTAKLSDINQQLTAEIADRKQIETRLRRYQEQLRRLSTHQEQVREHERTRIARELHDEFGQILYGLVLEIVALKNKMSPDQKELKAKADYIRDILNQCLDTIRNICKDLRPNLLDDLGLCAAIDWQAREFQQRSGIACTVSIKPEEITATEETTNAIFRIFQETLTNVYRHSQGTNVKVELKDKPGELYFTVRDNGVGITEEQISDSKSFGLMGIRERIRSLNGEVSIKGTVNKGTTLVVRIPTAT